MYGGGLLPTLLTSARIVAHYIKLLIFPITLNADYSYNAFPISYSLIDGRVIFALAVLGAAWWGIYRLLAFDRWAAFGGLWFFITLLPVSQIIPHHEIMAEHFLYLPSAGLFLIAGLLLERSMEQERRRVAVVAGFAAVVLLLGLRTVVRNRDWRDSETLWAKTVRTAPESARARTNLGEIAYRKGRYQEAYREFLEAIRILPDATNHNNLGQVLLRHGLFEEAEREFKEAIRLYPTIRKSRLNLGLLYLNRGQLDNAEREFRDALEIKATRRKRRAFRATVLNNLGVVLALKGKSNEAEKSFKEAIRLSPKYADARANLGKAYLDKGMTEEGIAEITKAIQLKGSDARFHYILARAYYQQGEKELAAVELGKTLSLRADFPEARSLLDKIIREKGSGRGKRG
jgi:Flp pilus assembly protein TadD